jgi:hypothetical protein
VIRRSAKLLTLYLAGAVLVVGWSLSHVLGGTLDPGNAAGVIVFPLAWIFGFWPTVLPILLAHRRYRLRSTLEDYCMRRASGLPTDAPARELEDTLTLLAAQENGIPERFVRPFVQKVLRTAAEDAGA